MVNNICGACEAEECEGKPLYTCKQCGCKFCEACGDVEKMLCDNCRDEDMSVVHEEEKEIAHDLQEFTQESD